MKYADLVQFDAIETVVQLRDAAVHDDARRLVQTYVISDRMAEVLTTMVFPQLQFARPADNKGLLIVGNYGTGKSHLLAVLSSVAENADLAEQLTNPEVAKAAADVAGRFKVIRAEIGAAVKPLRDIVCGVLERELDRMGVHFEFPPLEDVHENKTSLEAMMGAFQAVYPDHGLLFVLDEMLDYLRHRKELELGLDLAFLRELGEVCKDLKLRFLAGVQESLFDNPRFNFASESLRRVKDRFAQVRIAREDVAYVVSRRLLRKTPEQEKSIRDHLQRFTPFYGSMNERMDDFVKLFPVHPAYLEVFEKVYVAEKREILKTLSTMMGRMLQMEVPTNEPGLIAYDSYWPMLKDNPAFRADPQIKLVVDKSDVLEGRIRLASPNKAHVPVALRIIHALSVHRLTQGDVNVPMGATAEELRDALCLWLPVPDRDPAEALKTRIEMVLAEIMRTVSGQFLGMNRENGQYYLDLHKDVDYDALIDAKADTLDAAMLDSYWFRALRQVVLETPEDKEYRTGYRIWQEELEWLERKAGRRGYLFFGAPNERTTTAPPRDFYLYFKQVQDASAFKAHKAQQDEVFFELKRRDEVFDRALKRYAAACEHAASATGIHRKIYDDKGAEALRTLTKWLADHALDAFEVTHGDRSRSLGEAVRGRIPGGEGRGQIRDFVRAAASGLLGPWFAQRYPDYPVFSIQLTQRNLEQATQEALRWIAGAVKSKQGAAVLDALLLLEGDVLRPRESRYARQILDALQKKGQGQVLNRGELVLREAEVEFWMPFRMEPQLLVVVLAALVHSGDVVISLPGRKFDASGLDLLAKAGVADLADFKHVERPKDLPLAALQALCELLGIPPGLMVSSETRDAAVSQIQSRAGQRLEELVKIQSRLPELVFAGKTVLSEVEQGDWRKRLGALKAFLESLQPFNAAGKLKTFPHDVQAIEDQKVAFGLVAEVRELDKLVQQVAPMMAWLGKAEAVLPAAHPWVALARQVLGDLLTKLGVSKNRADPAFQRALVQQLNDLRSAYQDAYQQAHRQARLGSADEQKQAALRKDPRTQQMVMLAGIDMMPVKQWNDLHNSLLKLRPCAVLDRKDLDRDPVCPHCHFRPVEEPALDRSAGQVVQDFDARLDDLLQDWTRMLLKNLDDGMVKEGLANLTAAEGPEEIAAFLASRALPDPVTPTFVLGIQRALVGLTRVVIHAEDLKVALSRGGTPCTPKDLRERFNAYVDGLEHSSAGANVRIVIE